MDATLRERVVDRIETTPTFEGIPNLVGQRGGGHLRGALATLVPEVRTSGSPLYLLLDDISGTSLIGGVAFVRQAPFRELAKKSGERRGPRPEDMEGVCIGFASGSSALTEVVDHLGPPRMRPIGDLVHPDDPHGWHDLPLAILDAPLADLRDVVLERLARTRGCTHLNDALRALAEVPALIEALEVRP